MTAHLDLDQLTLSTGDLPSVDRAHLESCPRCRVEAKMLRLMDKPHHVQDIDRKLSEHRTMLTDQIQVAINTISTVDLHPSAPSTSSPEWTPDRLDVKDWIGVGPSNQVYLATDRHTAKQVVVKIPRSDGPLVQIDETRLAQIQARSHPNLCTVKYRMADGTWIVERAHGPDFISWVRGVDDDPVPSGEADRLRLRLGLSQVVAGLSALVDGDIHHGRLHPLNIRVDGSGRVKLMDFGLLPASTPAEPRGAFDPFRLYRAPELGPCDVGGVASDLYSLGVILGEALLGRPPRDSTALENKPWCQPQDLVELAKRLMHPEPEKRPDLHEVSAMTSMSNLPTQADVSRYDLLDPIASGAMGEVRRVTDRDLNRTLAMKIAHDKLQRDPPSLARFVGEAQLTAQLQHPAIVPVHELGRLEDGQTYFTMKEIEGGSLSEAIRDFHSESSTNSQRWTLRRLISALHRVCEALAYAHGRDVLHRDIKPDNIMLGAYGEVLLVDWGIAKVMGQTGSDNTDPVLISSSSDGTRAGHVSGTVGYIAPELLSPVPGDYSMETDVYSVGICLYQILAGRRPFNGDPGRIITLCRQMDPTPPSENSVGVHAVPTALEAICMLAISRDPTKRPANAEEMGMLLQDWLDGAQRRTEALKLVDRADDIPMKAEALRAKADELARQAELALEGLASFAPVEDKWEAWAQQDRAKDLRREATMLNLDYVQMLYAALHHDSELTEAHERLASHFLTLHQKAEAARDTDTAAEHEVLIRIHDKNGQLESYLRGVGTLSLTTDAPQTEVRCRPVQVKDRRWVPGEAQSLGQAPLESVELPMGSYLLDIHSEGRPAVTYPIFITRNHHWNSSRPGSTEPTPVHLPNAADVPPNACLVSAGPTWIGGDPDALNEPFAGQWIWLDGYWIQRFPVTVAEYIQFLDSLLENGSPIDQLQRLIPQERTAAMGTEVSGALVQGPTGRFQIAEHFIDSGWTMNLPITMIDRACAGAYAEWWTHQTGRPWRLPTELEWEKAARGVDGRFFPWGEGGDPSRCHMAHSHPGKPIMAEVDTCPDDCSPYGVRGMAGNVRDWCLDNPQANHLANIENEIGITQESPGLDESDEIVTRGGSWYSLPDSTRSATRQWCSPGIRSVFIGFRLCSPLK